ncbi:cytochrome P450 [Daedaleopsis nitida]|nr:cytochrome P450 [Daedaleopsis nitida]
MDSRLLVLLAGAVLLVYATIRRYLTGRHLRKVRGPKAPSWLLGEDSVGHNQEMVSYLEVGDFDGKCMAEYGTAWRLKDCMGADALAIVDPKALQYIFHKSGYHFPKTVVSRQITREFAGDDSILIADDDDHARMRKIMSPAFTASQLKSFLPLFRSTAQKLGQKWKDVLQQEDNTSGARLDVNVWLARCTLDVIGDAGFDVQCGALDDSLNPVMEAYKNMFADAVPFPSKWTILFRSLVWPHIPMSILKYVKYIPTKDHIRFRRTLDIVNDFAKSLIDEKTGAILAGKGENQKDMMSILVKANASENPKQRLSEQEMTSQVATLVLAGHETTSNIMTWLLRELAERPDYQSKMREETRAMRARISARGDTDFSMSDMDSMTYCVAAVKEVLRLHPVVYTIMRVARRDDVIPLAYPVTTSTGESVKDISVPKGTNIFVSLWGYNRLPHIWGDDANEFNPQRFVEHEKMGETYVGVTANLMSFSAGPQACIGWRFAMMEMQTIIIELIENFEFHIPDDKPEIIRFAAGISVPLVKSDMAAGPQMPLWITPVR